MHSNSSDNVWVEKYRPSEFNDIVLSQVNHTILSNIVTLDYFPHLLFYGPPGTGKTTTIINLINSYQKKKNNVNSRLVIHLNASDERGIDVIRNQINDFVNTNSLFNTGMKFVVLDEVDYMTKMAQQALQCLLQKYNTEVRFCLICNYISKIDDGLQTEFIKLRFNQLNDKAVTQFLSKIVKNEGIVVSEKCLNNIRRLYKSDIRSMINFIQSHEIGLNEASKQGKEFPIIGPHVWNNITKKLGNTESSNKKIKNMEEYIHKICILYNIDNKSVVKEYLNHVIMENIVPVEPSFMAFVENIIHSEESNPRIYIMYMITAMESFITQKHV
jgi:replication factor C subunit 3/5